jgi:nucleotide-binding universal stress UspA family protein
MGSVADNIEKVIEEHGVNLVVMGDESRRGFFERIFFSNDSARIIEKSTCPVLILTNETTFNPYKSVSLACGKMDFAHLKAIDFIADFTGQFETEIAIVHVSNTENTESSAIHEKEYKQSVASYKLLIDYKNITWHTLTGKDVADILDKFSCFTDADLTCIIHQKHPFYQSLFYNSITKQLIGDHRKPILIFPPTFQEAEGSEIGEQAFVKKYSTYEKS